ncbi:MAG: signal recognition particle protein, partial [bacterium]|nr:signal recognition particle protein [bacterium]
RTLMTELGAMARAASPHEVLLVLDAMTGQESVAVARGFSEHIDLTGVVLSKLDSDARGGAAISVREATGYPIKLVGTGEGPRDLEVFHPERMASRILGMGDVLTLMERAEEAVDQQQAADMAQRLLRAEFTLDDYIEQVKSLRRMGSVGELLGMIPGARPALADAQAVDREVRRSEAIICSMTPAERVNPKVIDGSRRRRIALGSGTSVQDVTGLVRQFNQMRSMFQSLSGGKTGMAFPGMRGGFPGIPSGGLPGGLPGRAMPGAGGRARRRPAGRPKKKPRTPKKLQKKKKR